MVGSVHLFLAGLYFFGGVFLQLFMLQGLKICVESGITVAQSSQIYCVVVRKKHFFFGRPEYISAVSSRFSCL